MSLECVPLFPLLSILRYVGRPADFSPIFQVCKSWRDHFDSSDVTLWSSMSQDFDISMASTTLRRTLRSTSDHRRAFFRAYYRKLRETDDKQEILVIQAKLILHQNRDQPAKLEKLVLATFPNINYFDPNYRCKTMEDNTLLTLACRNGQLKCIKLLVERFNCDINMADMGGFTPLILCAYHGNFAGVLYLLGKGANIRAVGKLRSGLPLTAEHWAAIQGHWEIFRYLHALRRRTVRRYIPESKTESLAVVNTEMEMKSESPLALTLPSNIFNEMTAGSSSSQSSVAQSFAATSSGEDDTMDLLPTFLIFADSYFDIPSDGFGLGLTAPENTQLSLAEDFPALSHLAALSSQYGTSSSSSASIMQSADGGSYCGVILNSSVDHINTSAASSSSSSSSVTASNPAPSAEENSFCYCRKGFEGQMIACDGEDCAVEWFHYSCVGLHARPAGKWYCPPCGIPDSRVMCAVKVAIDQGSTAENATDEEYCVCGRGYLGRMVGCDNPKCLVEWFHFECVNLTTEPSGHWECPACSGERFLQPTAFAQLEPPAVLGRKRGAKRGRSAGRPRGTVAVQAAGDVCCDGGLVRTATSGNYSSAGTSTGSIPSSGSQLRPKRTVMVSPEKRQRVRDHAASVDPAQSPAGQKSASVVRSCSRRLT